MKFYMPTKLRSGPDCVARHAEELASLGSHALIVTGRYSARLNHALDDVTDALKKHGKRYTVFDRIEENPSVETVMTARAAGLEAGANFVIGIGGGSPMDAAKAIAVMLKNPEQDWQYLYQSVSAESCPVAAVPTTCGTGSEVTGVAVLTRHDLQTKVSMTHKVFPVLALSDGKYLQYAPQSVIRSTAVDALAHLTESYINTNADELSRMTASNGLSMWAACRQTLLHPETLSAEAAQALMDTATLAGISIAQTGTSIPHALSYILTYRGGIPHGAAAGVFLANYIRYADHDMQKAVLSSAGFRDADELQLFLQNLAPVQSDPALLNAAAESVLRNPAKLRLCPYPVDAALMQEIIRI